MVEPAGLRIIRFLPIKNTPHMIGVYFVGAGNYQLR